MTTPTETEQSGLAAFVNGEAFRNSVMTLIIVNAIVIGLQTSDSIVAQYGPLLSAIDTTILVVFILELALRLYVDARGCLRSGWFWFDAIVIVVAILPLPGNLSVIRTLRVLRVMRLLTVSPKMRRVVTGLLNAIPGMATVMGVLAVVFYVFAVFATETFGHSDVEDANELFGTLGRSLFTLFQIMTLEDWSGVARPLMAVFPWAWFFFVLFVTVTAFAVLNLFIGIIVDAMQDDRDETLQGLRDEEERVQRDRFEMLLEEIRKLQADVADLKRSALGDAAVGAPRSSQADELDLQSPQKPQTPE